MSKDKKESTLIFKKAGFICFQIGGISYLVFPNNFAIIWEAQGPIWWLPKGQYTNKDKKGSWLIRFGWLIYAFGFGRLDIEKTRRAEK